MECLELKAFYFLSPLTLNSQGGNCVVQGTKALRGRALNMHLLSPTNVTNFYTQHLHIE